MSVAKTLRIVFTSLLLLSSHFARAQSVEKYVYQVQAYNFPKKWSDRSQTGFLATVNGQKGIVTALHGVAGAGRITARTGKGVKLRQELRIAYIDIEHDLALLSSGEIEKLDDDGMPVADKPDWSSIESVTVHGHPYGIKGIETRLRLRKPALRNLEDLLPEELKEDFKKRDSPSHSSDVVSIQGTILPGHSGAPLVDAEGNAVAVGNGGLKEGFAEICWAIPFQDISWERYARNKINKLLEKDPANLFAYEPLKGEVTKYTVTFISPPPSDLGSWDYVFKLDGREVGRFKFRGYGPEKRFSIKLPDGTHNFELRVFNPNFVPRPEFFGDFEITVDAAPGRYRVIPWLEGMGSLRIDVTDLSDE